MVRERVVSRAAPAPRLSCVTPEPGNSTMQPRVSLVTLGVADLARAVAFYRDGLGWPVSSVGGDGVAFFRTGGVILSLYPWSDLAADAGLAAVGPGSGFRGIALAHNVAGRDEVDAVLAEAVRAGATLLRSAHDAFWGGRSGYFADPDGHAWEIAWNPGFPFAADGSLILPD